MGWLRSNGRRVLRRQPVARAVGVERVWAQMSGAPPEPQPAFLLAVGRPGSRRRFRFAAVNAAYRAQLVPYGIGADARIVGRTPRDLLPANFADQAERRYEQVLATGEAVCYRAGFELPDGSLGFDVVLQPIGDCSGRLTHVLGVAHERARLDQETALRDTEHRFAALVEQRPTWSW